MENSIKKEYLEKLYINEHRAKIMSVGGCVVLLMIFIIGSIYLRDPIEARVGQGFAKMSLNEFSFMLLLLSIVTGMMLVFAMTFIMDIIIAKLQLGKSSIHIGDYAFRFNPAGMRFEKRRLRETYRVNPKETKKHINVVLILLTLIPFLFLIPTIMNVQHLSSINIEYNPFNQTVLYFLLSTTFLLVAGALLNILNKRLHPIKE